jgi:hypothetical protein
MKLITLLFLIGLLSSAFAEPIPLARTTDSVPSYVWTFSSEPPPKLPKWKKGENPPLSVLEAERLAYAWTKKQSLAGYIPERPFDIALLKLPGGTDEDYYYRLNYGSEAGKITFWTVFILMDGHLIEPRKIKEVEPVRPANPPKVGG